MDDSAAIKPTADEFREMLLRAARNGDHFVVEELMQARSESRISLDINCPGRNKCNYGWTPLHLASYFGHLAVAEVLLKNNADVNVVNDAGDTPLHKAAFTGREALVLLLLKHNAELSIINGEGQTARDVSLCEDVTKLLQGAETTEMRRREEAFLRAAREGDLISLSEMLKRSCAISINCTDTLGNTALHCASYRGHKEIAILLLQNGLDSSLLNSKGQTAMQLAQSEQMKQILNVRPVRKLQQDAVRFEGVILKRSKFFGYRETWVVVERGVLTYFRTRADACSGVKRKGYKLLERAKIIASEVEPNAFAIFFCDGATHRFCLTDSDSGQLNRQKWINALEDHVSYCAHYLNQGTKLMDSDDEMEDALPLGSMQDAFQNAQAYQRLLETRVTDVDGIVQDFQDQDSKPFLQRFLPTVKEVADTSHRMLDSLGHCLTIFTQQQEVTSLQLKQEREKCRVLEQALHVLAKEHHELEQSIVTSTFYSPKSNRTSRSPCFYDTSDDEFYDAFDGESSANVTLNSGSGTTISHMETKLGRPRRRRKGTKFTGRTNLPVPMFVRNDFSIWSILKQCIGKDLSKITMPVIFNEPLSFLQRFSENMEYANLLNRASECEDPVARMEYVCAFAVSAVSSNWDRLGKPFNPLLGETYELERDDFRIIVEQVSHHPPICAFHADSPQFLFHGSVNTKLKFWGKSVEIEPKGLLTIEFPKHQEVYTYENVNCCIHNIIVGKLWLEQYGVMEITNHKTGHRCVLNFKPAGWFSKDLHRLEGYIYDKNKKKLRYIYGKWTDLVKSVDMDSYEEYVRVNADKFRRQETVDKSPRNTPTASPARAPKKGFAKFNLPFSGLSSQSSGEETAVNGVEIDEGDVEEPPPKGNSTFSLDIPNSTLLWENGPRPENAPQYYQFTLFAMALNEMEDGMEKKMAPTDSRLRPDIRKLEEGDIDGAAAEKNRLEEKQREARKNRKKYKDNSSPKWFHTGPTRYSKSDDWIYTGSYWDRDFSECPDIF